MKHLDWQMLFFVGISLLQDYWACWGPPRIYYWDVKRKILKRINIDFEDDDNKVA